MKQVTLALAIVSLLFAFSPSSNAGIGGAGGGPKAFMRFTVCDDALSSDCSVVEYQLNQTDGKAVATSCLTDSALERAALCVGEDTFPGWVRRLTEAYTY